MANEKAKQASVDFHLNIGYGPNRKFLEKMH